ncbi:MAG: hypothetical protein ACRDKV_11050, partial [Solirubrobacterales bacterium]
MSSRIPCRSSCGTNRLTTTQKVITARTAAAIALHPGIEPALESLRGAGAARALITGSGPTAFG